MSSRHDSVQNIPPGWAPATVGAIADYLNGIAFKPSDWEAKGRPIIRIQNLTGQSDRLNLTTREVDPAYIVQPGTILVSWSATLDVFVWHGPEALLNQHIFKVVPVAAMSDHSFVRWALKNAIDEMWRGEHTHGTTMRHINRGPFLAHWLSLPPVNEQVRIADAIESYLTRLDDAVASLERVQAKLKAYRASVLKAAVEGQLVPTEASLARAEKRDYESAEVLLARILRGRRRRWEEAELAKPKAAGKTPKDDKSKGKYEEPAPTNTRGLPELPKGWTWARLEQVTDVQLGQQRAPIHANAEQHIPYIRAANITWSGLHLNDVKEMGFPNPERYRLLYGDVLLSEASGSPMEAGKPAIWRDEIPGACYQKTLLRVRAVDTRSLLPEYLRLVFLRDCVTGQFARLAPGVGIVHLTAERMLVWPIPLPPLPEQQRIVDEADRLESFATNAKSNTNTQLARLQRLRQSVLKWAFEGKLVDQDPTDEPAERLLTRIRAERAATARSKKTGGGAAKGAV